MKNILWFKKKTIKHGKTTYSSQDENILLDYISLNPRLPLINSYLFLNNYFFLGKYFPQKLFFMKPTEP
jgi:hypothetical protein